MATFRGFGPSNANLPVATGQVIGMMRDPSKMPFIRYTQYVPAPPDGNGLYRYAILNPDDPVRLANLNEYAWALDSRAPKGDDFRAEIKWDAGQTARNAFPYTLGERTMSGWAKEGIGLKQLYDKYRANTAMLHRAVRVVTALGAASWGANSDSLATLLPTTNFFDESSGTELLSSDIPNPAFQIIKRTFQKVKRRINLATNGRFTGEEFVAVLPVDVAIAMSTAGEIVNAVKQSMYAKELTNPNMADWSLPESYGGFKLVVEDTVRCLIRHNADGTVADVSVSTEKGYILDSDTIYFVARPGGLDGQLGFPNFSTVQCYTFNGEAQVEARSDSWDQITEGRVVTEDEVRIPSTLTGFALTDVLST